MDTIFYIIAIFGCGDAGGCQQARIAEPRYATAAQCRAAIAPTLMASTDLDYPTIRAACRKGGRHEVSATRPR